MPWTPAQIRLFFAQANRGEISHEEAQRRAREGTRKDVDRSGHVRKKKRKVKRKKTRVLKRRTVGRRNRSHVKRRKSRRTSRR